MKHNDLVKQLGITLSTAAALSLGGCQASSDTLTAERNTAVCTDISGRRTLDSKCEHRGGGGAWYFVSRGGSIPYMGENVSGGSYNRSTTQPFYRASKITQITRPTGVSRGGFGGSARSFLHAGG